jgi:Bacterial regulatory proteins, luxR family
VRLVAEGMQNREIANELKLSEHTVKNYLFRIFDKLGVSSRVELVLYAVSNKRPQADSVWNDKRESELAGAPELSTTSTSDADRGHGAKSSQSLRKEPERQAQLSAPTETVQGMFRAR